MGTAATACCPLSVQGYYTKTDRNADQRAEQVICQPGHYCIAGVNYECPAGVYGNSSGLSTVDCTGPLPRVHVLVSAESWL
jgi:hypothetical protein